MNELKKGYVRITFKDTPKSYASISYAILKDIQKDTLIIFDITSNKDDTVNVKDIESIYNVTEDEVPNYE